MSSARKKTWAEARKNVDYEGCYPDYAYLHDEYKDPKYYHVPRDIGKYDKSRKEVIRNEQDDFMPKGPVDPRLPPPRKYTAYLDGPARIIPSIDKLLTKEQQTKSLDQALRRCYDLARAKNKQYFALQNGGKLCMATDSPNFMTWGKLPDGECKACKHKCPEGTKPCGKRCVKHDEKCRAQQHAHCSDDQFETGNKGGGYFTNSVFKIKVRDQPEEVVIEDQNDEFSKFRYARPEIKDEMACPKVPNNFFDLSPTQLFMQQYFTIETPIKGMLIYKSAGAGKTCEALNVIGNFMGKWEIIWVTRQSLRNTPLKNLYNDICQIRLRELIDSPKPITLASGEVLATTKDEKIKFIRSERGPAVLKRYGIEIEKQRIISYDNFVKMIAGKGGEGKKLKEEQTRKTGDIGYKTLFVFDEAHNLISSGLPKDERQELDAVFSKVKIGEKVFSTKEDIYGAAVTGPLQGRDLIPAMFWESYKASGKDSAKCLLLTGTPMSTSPSELFWLMNLLLETPNLRLSLNLNDYYDAASMKLKDESIIRFARAAHGRISFLDITQNPTTFARKIFFDRLDVSLHKFQQKIIDDAVEKEKAKKSTDWTKIVSLYQNLSVMARTTGSFFDSETLQEFDRNLKRLESWDPDKERQYQTDLYRKHVHEARLAFKMNLTDKDQKLYDSKVKQYQKWTSKHGLPKGNDAVDAYGNLLTFEEWAYKVSNEPEPQVPKHIQKEYETLMKRKLAYDEKVKNGQKPKKPDLKGLLKTDGTVKSLAEFYEVQANPVSKRERSTYDRLVRAYKDHNSKMADFNVKAKQSERKREPMPDLSPAVQEVMDEFGLLLSPEEWVAKRKAKPEQKKYTKEQMKYVKYLIRDPASGKMRIRTLEEFVQVLDPVPTLEGKETRKATLLMWHKTFNPKVARELIPFYAPRIHECIQMIIEREKQAEQELGHGLKHTVFTFSTASKEFTSFGSRAVASAFHAYQDLFKVLLVYKNNEDGKFVLRDDIPNDNRWGVAVLSSKDLPNIYVKKHGGNQKVEYNPKIVGATQAAFNDIRNKYGKHIKVLIMDGAYTEGVEAYDDSIGHFLNEGLSPPQLEQASARSVRFCNSKSIPFYKGVGGFMEMYFYSQKGLNEQMLQHVPYEEQLNINMLDVFKDLCAQFSIDYWLNFNVNDFRPVYEGKLQGYYDKWNQAYLITKPLEISEKNDASKKERKVDYRFIVDPDSVITQIKVHSKVTDTDGKSGVVTRWTGNEYEVRYEDGTTATKKNTELRLSPGQTVEFQIPYGIDLAKKIMNIGNYNAMMPSTLNEDMIKDIRIPQNALSVVSTAFDNNVLYLLLGILSMLRMIIKTNIKRVPIDIILPPADEGDSVPAMSNFSMQWRNKTAKVHYLTMKRFLSAKDGVSIMFLTLGEQNHVNLLIYVPQWGTVERFDPMGYAAHLYDSVALDSYLHDVFNKYSLVYMSAAETCPLIGLQRLGNSKDHCTIFAIFYLHMRIMYAADHLATYPKEKREVFPLQFQRGLVNSIKTQSVDLSDYIRNYAELAVQSRAFVSSWNDYDESLPFWANTVRLIEVLLRQETVQERTRTVREENPKVQEKEKSFFQKIGGLINMIL